MDSLVLTPIGHIRSDFSEKFGIPRQSGMVAELRASVVFTPEFTVDTLRGIGDFSHIWLLWGFSENFSAQWHPTVRPPRLVGERKGVFATRSPLRPNPIGMSSVRLLEFDDAVPARPVLHVAGADLLDGTPIYDIKPYVASDCHPDASRGYTAINADRYLDVEFPEQLAALVPSDKLPALRGILAQDPRPAFHDDAARVYGVTFAGLNVRFRVAAGVVQVLAVQPLAQD
ncbi:MAG: tRNA (N6-threonylcarbamoyladenosine(37)-N6)-methyltransferase TrmO [Trueperella sp.]|nr:tRNA (N6-threonylcarbamoyladenosine(37)-N6)-methyltransferase TrmO [Trueperella sp.]